MAAFLNLVPSSYGSSLHYGHKEPLKL